MSIRAVRRDLAVLHTVAAHIRGVVRVKVQEPAARLQNPEPFPVGLLRFRKRPCEIAAENHIKAFLRIGKCLRVHLPEYNIEISLCGKRSGFLQHGRRQINALYLMPRLRQQHRKKAGSCADVQNPQMLLLRQKPFYLTEPFLPHFIFKLIFSHCPKVVRAQRPIVPDALLHCRNHCHTSFSNSPYAIMGAPVSIPRDAV